MDRCVMQRMMLILIIVISVIPIAQSVLKLEQSRRLSRPLTKMQYHNGMLYVGGKNMLYALNTDLNVNKSVSTCNGTNCNNITKVLSVHPYSPKLISCGTGSYCVIRHLNNLSKSAELVNTNIVSADLRPANGMFTRDGKFVLSVTFGKGIENAAFGNNFATSYKYAISSTNIETLYVEKMLKLYEKVTEEKVKDENFNLDDHVIYFKKNFQHNGFSYFITNQKSDSGTEYISKLIQICQNDTAFNSYVDVVISCENGYNLIQDALIISANETVYFVGVFAQGEQPDKFSGSIICGGPLEKIHIAITDARRTFLSTSCDLEDDQKKNSYLPNNFESTNCSGIKFVEGDFICKQPHNGYTYVRGNKPTMLNKMFDLPSDEGTITTIQNHTVNGNKAVILAGTSEGKIIMMNFDGQTLQNFSSKVVPVKYPIRAIYQVDDETMFVLSEYEVMKYATTNCSEFTSCQHTMSVRNPLCGWCVFKQRATRNGSSFCEENQWLHSLTSCITLDTNIKGVKTRDTTGLQYVQVTASKLPKSNGTAYCRYLNGQNEINKTEAVLISSTTFNCSIPAFSEHTNATLEFMVDNIIIATTPFLFYKCSHYKRCGQCVSTAGAECMWDKNRKMCNDKTSTSNDFVVTNKAGCPALNDSRRVHFVPGGEAYNITLPMINIHTGMNFECYLGTVNSPAITSASQIECTFNKIPETNSAKKNHAIIVKYNGTSIELDDEFDNYVTVYNCSMLGEECGMCSALNESRYKCDWCNSKCTYGAKCNTKCPAPVVTSVHPSDGPVGGGTLITIQGREFGLKYEDIKKIELGNKTCDKIETINSNINQGDFQTDVPKRVVCKTVVVHDSLSGVPQQVIVTVDNSSSRDTEVVFTYKKPNVTGIYPMKGPVSGGTVLTIAGKNLNIGSKSWEVSLGKVDCKLPKVITQIDVLQGRATKSVIECVTGNFTTDGGSNEKNLSLLVIKMDLETHPTILKEPFRVLPDPIITHINGREVAFISGGTVLTVVGTNLDNANVGQMKSDNDECGEKNTVPESCTIVSDKETVCRTPKLCEKLKEELMRSLDGETNMRRKRDTCSGCRSVSIIVKLDGIEQTFKLDYYRDPEIDTFKTVTVFKTDQHQLVLSGKYLNLVASKDDFNVTIGLSECTVIELTDTQLICTPPKDQPSSLDPNNKFPEVNVQVGNIAVHVGRLEYEQKVELIAIIGGAVAGGLLFIFVIIVVVGCYKYRKVGKKAREYEQNLSNMEMEIKRVAREEFLDMHTTMSSVNRNLVEQGFPYHSYQQFACNVMFSVDYLWTEPVVSNGKMTDDERMKANKGMESLESLISNKFFLVSVITTMEKEKKFFIREKSNLAGNLCAVLMGKMDYLNEILKLLMTNLVQESSPKKHKTLFRRCESITEKLLSNWVSLCLYPHILKHSGSSLYLLYMATQKTMESGPIDAVTGDAKYTLAEEKLLKKWSSQEETKDLKLEAKTLTLNVVVDNGEEIFKCKALDCDTISQVKNKCLNQIYVNYPASKISVGAKDLALEWHEGFGGVLKLKDEDNTSKRDGHWIRLNTLAHYNVKDDSNMALIDPHSAELNQQEDYVNLAQVNMDNICDGSMDSTEPLTPLTPMYDQNEIQHWHLVKKEEESSKQEKSAIAELYLNRLFTTKQSIMEYMRPMFDIILDHDRCPPPTKFLFDLLDDLGETYKVDSETVHAWKSHSYAIRAWASLMKMPNLLFDVTIQPYMDANLDIISQVFIESFSLASQKFTKDSPSQKLIFHHEMNDYREKVKEFYKNVKVDSANQDEFRQHMTEVNKLQQQTSFNKVSALYRFYNQLKPYFEDILENLSNSKEASDLHLDRKLEKVIAIMEEEEVK